MDMTQFGLIELPSKKTGIAIPSTLNVFEDGYYLVGQERPKTVTIAPNELIAPIVNSAKGFFAKFGGYTASNQWGGWMDNGALVEEKSVYVWAYCAPTEDDITTLVIFAQSVKAQLHQDSILVLIDDIPYLV